MKKYTEQGDMSLLQVVCNKCGRPLKVENGILKEGCFSGNTVFGYFSRKDGMRQCFDLCEDCYDAMVKGFTIPVEEIEEKELC